MSDSTRPWVIVLSGSSSAGKTSLARAFQQQVADPAWLFVADECFPKSPGNANDATFADNPIVVFHRGVGIWLAAGYNVILDGSLPYGDPQLRSACLEELRPVGDIYLVGVTATLNELSRREQVRPDARLAGWATHQHGDVNEGLDLVYTVDTTGHPPAECATDLLGQLQAATGRRWS